MSNHEHHGLKEFGAMAPFCRMSKYSGEQREDQFGRLFGKLAPAYTDPAILHAIGELGGPMDEKSQQARTHSVAVGTVFFGQFIDHDITLDTSSTFDRVVGDPSTIPNLRSPTLDLDCIYGLGPEAQPYLFEQGGPFGGVKLLTGADNPGQAGLAAEDLLRAPNGRAIIGDPRNDENRVISQMQLAFIRFHNHVAQTLHDESVADPAQEDLSGHDLYEETRRQVMWHYQWSVVNDFLVQMCGRAVIERILGCGRQVYCGHVPFIPVEFSVAAYRFGHSMIPMKLHVQENGPEFELFGPELGGGFDPIANADAVVDWNELLFTPAGRDVVRALQLDTKLASDLLNLPFIDPPGIRSLATRNLLRGNTFLLPGGEKVAETVGAMTGDAKAGQHIDKVVKAIDKLDDRIGADGIPLWLYLLAEAEVIGRVEENGNFKKGEGLGPVGATIVAEVLIGLLEHDDRSWLGANRNWRPREEWNTIGKMLTAPQTAAQPLPHGPTPTPPTPAPA